MIVYRAAEPEDLAACAQFEWTRSRQDLLWHIDGRWLYLADAGGESIAYARLESFWKTMPYLALVTVREDCRGQGVGSALLAFILDDLRTRGYTSLLSSSSSNEPEPQRWHLRNGFRPVGDLSGLNQGGIDETFFRIDV